MFLRAALHAAQPRCANATPSVDVRLMSSLLANDKWSLKAITWLMVQIWFGNTYLSFAQAESFHPVFGPILMTMFAALSNTLLLTSAYASTKCAYVLTWFA